MYLRKGMVYATAVTFLVVWSIAALPVGAAPQQWNTGTGANGHWYEFVLNETITWTSAKTAAESSSWMGTSGYLVTITSADEQTWIEEHILPEPIGGRGLWLGGFQDPNGVEPDQGWRWVTGESWGYANWHEGEPSNNSGYPPYEEDYLMMHLAPTEIPLWNDTPEDANGNSVGYIVEYVPEPSCLWLLTFGGLVMLRRRWR